jgi:hypothetical protein
MTVLPPLLMRRGPQAARPQGLGTAKRMQAAMRRRGAFKAPRAPVMALDTLSSR